MTLYIKSLVRYKPICINYTMLNVQTSCITNIEIIKYYVLQNKII